MSQTDAEEPWIICLEERLVYTEPENKWLKLYFDIVRFHDGRTGRYNRVIEGGTGLGVVVIPKREDGKIGLVRIYRYPIARWQWELPRGFAEEGASTEDDARRELLEESGFEAKRLLKVGELFPNSGVLSTRIEVFIAEELVAKTSFNLDSKDSISKLRFFSREELDALVIKGELTDGITLSALYIAKSRNLI
jgi:ADP-ribose pyrophosphatase